MVLLLVLFETIIILTSWGSVKDIPWVDIIVGDAFSAFKLYMYTCTGIHICMKFSSPDLPLTRMLFRENPEQELNFRSYVFSTLAVSLGAIFLTIILFKLTSAEISEQARQYFNLTDTSQGDVKITFSVLLMFLQPAFLEEISFRLCMQNFIANLFKMEAREYWISIVAASLVWAFAHGTPLNPSWLKLAQMFPIGIAFGVLSRKFGTESSIIAHAIFNVVLVFISMSLIKL